MPSVAVKENKMGVMPINRLLISMSLPMMISMFVQALYNVVDSIFVAKFSENAFTAVSLAFPLQSLLIGVSVGTGVGMGALLSRSLGEKNFKKVNASASNGLFLYLISYLVFLVLGLTCSAPFFGLQTRVEEISEFGTVYLTICLAGSFCSFAEIYFNRLLQSTGRTALSMVAQMSGAVVNIVLDPIMIFSLDMGIAGAAVATVIGQAFAAVLGMILNFTVNKEVKISFKGFRPDKEVIGTIYKVGLPSILMQSVGSVMVFFFNSILITFGEVACNAFGAYFKLQSFFFMPVFGLNNGMVPIIAYNYGAARKQRITKTVKLAVIYAVAIMAVGILITELFPEALLSLFSPSDEMLKAGVPALRIIALSFIGAAVSICLNSACQALGNGLYSFIVAVARQLVLLLPIAWLMSLTRNLDMVWLSFPIAELGSVALAVIFFIKLYKSKIAVLPDSK